MYMQTKDHNHIVAQQVLLFQHAFILQIGSFKSTSKIWVLAQARTKGNQNIKFR